MSLHSPFEIFEQVFKMELQTLVGELENLQQSLSIAEIAVSNLPSDSLQNMLITLKTVIEELRRHEVEAARLEKETLSLPNDTEAQKLGVHLAEIKTRILTLLTQADQGIATVLNAQKVIDQRNAEVVQYQQLLNEIETWLTTTKETLTEEVQLISEPQAKQNLVKYERIHEDLQDKERQLAQLTSFCEQNKNYADVEQMAAALLEQLSAIKSVLSEHKQLVTVRIERLRAFLVDVQERAVETVVQEAEMASSDDKTLDSSPMPEEEMVHSPARDVRKLTAEFLVQEQPAVCAVETQTSLSSPRKVVTKDISISAHPPVDMQVQTEFSSSSEAKPSKEKIQISKTVCDGEETIQISTKPVEESQPIVEEPDDLLVQAEYKDDDKARQRVSELSIQHSAPQGFETVFVEPDETTTEVLVDSDGTKRIIVRKMRRTVVSRQQTLQQQQLTSLHTLTEGDVPVTQSFSQVTLRGQQSSSTVATGDGKQETISSQNFGGRIVSNAPGGELNVQEFQMEPLHEVTVVEAQRPPEVEVDGIKVHEGDVTYIDNNNLSLVAAEGDEMHTSTSSVRAVVQQVTRRIIKRTKRIIKRVTIIDGKEYVTEEVVEEPIEIDVTEEEIPRVSINVTKIEDGHRVYEKATTFEPEPKITIVQDQAEPFDVRVTESFVQETPSLGQATADFIAYEQTPRVFSTEAETVEMKSPQSQPVSEVCAKEAAWPATSPDTKSSPDKKDKSKKKSNKPDKKTKDKAASPVIKKIESIKMERTVDQASSPIDMKPEPEPEPSEPIKSVSFIDQAVSPINITVLPEVPEQSQLVDQSSSPIKHKSDSEQFLEHEALMALPVDQASSPIIPEPLEAVHQPETSQEQEQLVITPEAPKQKNIKVEITSEKLIESEVCKEEPEKSESVLKYVEQATSPISIPKSPPDGDGTADVMKSVTEFIAMEQSFGQQSPVKVEDDSATPEITSEKQEKITSPVEISEKSEVAQEKSVEAIEQQPEEVEVPIPTVETIELTKSVPEELAEVTETVSQFRTPQTVEFSLSVEEKTNRVDVTPKVAVSMIVEKNKTSQVPSGDFEVVMKEVDVTLPSTKEVKNTSITTTSVALSPIIPKTPSDHEDTSIASALYGSGRNSKKKKKHREKPSKDTTPEEIAHDSPAVSRQTDDAPGASVETSLAESTEIIIAGGDSLVSDTPKPTEEIFDSYASHEPEDSDHADDTGYEPDDKTTVDEFSLDEDVNKKKKRKRKHKQKVRVFESEGSDVPQSLEESMPAEESAEEEEVKEAPRPTDQDVKKNRKRKRGKKDDRPELETDEYILETADTLEITSPNDSYKTFSETSEQGPIKVLEETVISSPQSEVTDIVTSQFVTTVPVLETTYVQESVMQTSPEVTEIIPAETVQERQSIILEHTSAQTSPEVPAETTETLTQTDQGIPEPKPELSNLSIQVETSEIIPASDTSSQTDVIVHAVPEKVDVTETCIQTATPEPVTTHEESMQTVTPEVTEIPVCESATQAVVESQEEFSQTLTPEPTIEQPKPEPEAIEKTVVETMELSVQTEREEPTPHVEEFIQTSPTPDVVKSDQAMQTVTPDISEKAQTQTIETTSQTQPVVVTEIGEKLQPQPTDETYEIHVKTVISVPTDEEPRKTVSEFVIESSVDSQESPSPPAAVDQQIMKGRPKIKSDSEPSSLELSAGKIKVSTPKENNQSVDETMATKVKEEQLSQKLLDAEKGKKQKHKRKHKSQATPESPSEVSCSSSEDFSIKLTVQGVPVSGRPDVSSFIDMERQHSEGFVPSKERRPKHDQKKELLDPRPTYSEITKRNSRSSSPVDDDRATSISESEPSSVVVGKVITDIDRNIVEKLSRKLREQSESLDSDSTLVPELSSDLTESTPEASVSEPLPTEIKLLTPEVEQLTIEIHAPEFVKVLPDAAKEKKKATKHKAKSKYTTSVTIEEVTSPTEVADTPLTPSSEGPMSPPNLSYPAVTTWDSKPSPSKIAVTQQLIDSERQVEHTVPVQNVGVQWKQVKAIERMKNMQNARKTTHLSNVLYLATMNEVVTEESIQQRNNDVQHNLNVLREAVAKQDTVIIQQTIVTTVETITTWLETIEYRIYLNRQQTSHGPSEERVQEFNGLKQEIVNIEQSIGELQGALHTAGDLCNEDDKAKLERYISLLQSQIKVIEEVADENKQQATSDLNRWIEFINGVDNVCRLIHEVKQQVDTVSDTDKSPSWKLKELEILENSNKCHMLKTVHLMATARGLMRDFPSRDVPQEMYNAHELSKHIDHVIGLEREKTLQLLSLADEYEQTLEEFAQITDIADALVESPLSVTNLEGLQEEMQKHRKFFVNLNHCRGILESLEGNLDSETRALHSTLHKKLHERASIILDKAASRAQQMALAASRWTVLEQGMREEMKWLQVAQQRVPDLSSVTSADYDQYINLYQSLSLDIAHHHAKLSQLNTMAQRLQELVNCTCLEHTYGDAFQIILRLQEDVHNNLKRLLAFKDTWSTYNLLTDKLEYWMRDAEDELALLHVPSTPKAPVTGNMKNFWELKAQHEVHNNIRDESGNTFEQAMSVIPVADEMLQRQFRVELQERWQSISSKIDTVQTAVIENISAPDVPINEKLVILEEELKDLKLVIEELHGIIKTEEELVLYIERLQVMHSRIQTLQNELGRLGLLSANESEKVGYLLALSKRLETHISEELENANLLKDKLHCIKRGLARVRKNHERIGRVLDECESCEKLGSDVVEKAVIDCQEMGDELLAHWQDLMGLRQLLHTLPMRLRVSVSPVKVEREISQSQDEHAALEKRCIQLLAMLRNRLALWHRFEHQLELVQQSVQEADYMMELLTVHGNVDYERLLKATERLEGLNNNFTSREQLIEELRAVAEPLREDCDPEVSARVQAAVAEAVTAWTDTCSNLRDLCTRYQDAVRLWKQYRDASDVVRAWTDQQMGTVTNLRPEDALNQVKVCEETLAAHMERLADLRGLVAQIAADVGLDASGLLQGEVEALGRRLEDVRESLTTLADVAENRALQQDTYNGELDDTKTFLNTVQKSLSNVSELKEDNCEEQLVALRNHLLALGKTETQIQNIKEKSLEITRSTKTETSVIEILELWQKVFRETFQQYHRLSTRLVKSQDSVVAIKLWHEYLLHVQTFLSSSIPEDYHSLTEHQHLCQVHQNLLTTQQNVLMEKTESEGKTADPSIMDKYNLLSNLHSETLARIVERHDHVSDRIQSWDQYRSDQSKLLGWLKEMEKERSRLQLRYIHLRRVPKVLTKIQSLLDRVPSGEEQIQNLHRQQTKLLQFCDDALATSIRMEHIAISQRISNLQAALETWKEFLLRIKELSKKYDSKVDRIQNLFKDIQQTVMQSAHEVPVYHSKIESKLENLRMLRQKVNDSTRDLEEISVTQEELKECVSPSDMKTINQKLWLLWQQQGDLEHQLAMLCHHLEEKAGLRNMFDARQARFINWAVDIEKRLDEKSEPGVMILKEPKDILRRLETELQAEMALKNREVNWLLSIGNELLASCGEDDEVFRKEIQAKVDEINNSWQKLQNLGKTKANKLHDIMQTMSQLEIRIAEIRAWLCTVESQLSIPIFFEDCTKDVFDRKMQEHDKLKKSIEKESTNVGDVLNLCELLLSDIDAWKVHFNTENITTAAEGLEKRWKIVCGLSAERKRKITSIWTLLQDVLRLSSQREEWLMNQEIQLQDAESHLGGLTQDQMRDYIYRLEKQIKDIDSYGPTLEILENSYSKLAKTSGLEPDNLRELTVCVKTTLTRWYALMPRAVDILQRLQREQALYREFIAAHGQAVVSLTQVDVQLTQFQHLPTPEQSASPEKQLEQIQSVETELQSHDELLKNTDKLGLMVMQKSRKEDITSVQEMIDEYQLLWKDIQQRISELKLQLETQIKERSSRLKTDVDESVQVETLRFEQDMAVQVNTLPLVRMTSITSKDAYIYELETAFGECTSNVNALEAIVNSSMPQQGNPEIHSSARTLAKLIATCQSSVELIKHLNNLLITECHATDAEARSVEIGALAAKFEQLLVSAKARELKLRELSEAGRLLCPLCTSRNWQQLDNDMWRLEKWLQFAESTQRAQHPPPSDIEELEDVIQDHREFLLDLDSHKSLVRSLNIVGTHLADHTVDTSRAEELRDRLKTGNGRWEWVCRDAAKWQTQLQKALMENRQFHQTIDELCAWLEATEHTIRASEPVDLTADQATIEAKYMKFAELRAELERCEPRVMSLQEAADQLLRSTDSPEGSSTTYSRLTDLRLRLQSLRRLTSVYILKLGSVLGRDPNEITVTLATPASSVGTSLHSLSYDLLDEPRTSEVDHAASTELQHTGTGGDEINTSVLTRGYRFLGRVVRASLPIQALMLLLLGVASLVPSGEDDYSCSLSNNFARSWEPMLRYPNGPPPI